jgi:hypothetical protein
MSLAANIESDEDMEEILMHEKINGIKINITNDDPIVMIGNKDSSIGQYKTYDDYLYSPLVMYASHVNSYNDGFIQVPNSNKVFKVDFYNILTAMEQDKEWGELGFHKHVINGKITLHIPSEHSLYYDHVVDLFYLTLNNGTLPNETTKGQLKDRVDNLLNKCVKVSDICQSIYDEYKKESKTHKVFIAPEFLFARGVDTSIGAGDEFGKAFRPIYFSHTIYLTADLHIRCDEDNNVNPIGLKFINNIQTKAKFMNTTGWRSENRTFQINKASYVLMENP